MPGITKSHAAAIRPGAYHVSPVTQRRDAIKALMADYAATHPGATDANTSVLDVSLWLASKREVRPAQ